MKNVITILILMVSVSGFSQQVLTRTNTASTTNKSWQIYRQNSPTNVYGNSFVLFEVNYDTVLNNAGYVKIGILDNRMGYLPSKKFITADNNGYLSQGSFDNLTFGINQITNLNTMLMDRPTFSQVSSSYQPAGNYLIATDTLSLSNRINSKQNSFSGSTSQYVRGDGSLATLPTNNVYNNGFGLSKSGTEPSATFSINTADIMTVNRASDSISSINTRVNGKVSASTTLTINGVTQDLSTNRTYSNVGIELPSQTGQSGKFLQTNGTTTSWAAAASSGSDSRSGYGTGTPYSLTNTSAKITMGTTSPTVTLPAAGTYLILSNLKLDYAGLTTVGTSTANFKLRRTNNTAADLANATASFTSPVVTLLTAPAGDADIQGVLYTTTTSGDIIEMWGNRGANISVGNLNVSEAWIIAIRIY